MRNKNSKLLVLSLFVLLIVLVLYVVFIIFFVFVLCHLPNVAYVSGLSILDCPFGFLLYNVFLSI